MRNSSLAVEFLRNIHGLGRLWIPANWIRQLFGVASFRTLSLLQSSRHFKFSRWRVQQLSEIGHFAELSTQRFEIGKHHFLIEYKFQFLDSMLKRRTSWPSSSTTCYWSTLTFSSRLEQLHLKKTTNELSEDDEDITFESDWLYSILFHYYCLLWLYYSFVPLLKFLLVKACKLLSC